MNSLRHTFLNGKRAYGFESRDALLDVLQDYQGILVACNAEKTLNPDPDIKRIINANLGYSDGVGVVWALRRKGVPTVKIAGAELWLSVVERFVQDKSFYLVGASDEVIEQTVKQLRSDFPQINILGYRNGYLSDQDELQLQADLQELQPDVVFVAMGSPRQEILMDRLMQFHPALYQGLGGSFDVYTGLKKRAPKIFCQLGLEWFYRLCKEPTRFGRQIVLIRFLILLIFRRL